MPYTDIRYEKKDGVAWITIDRPEVRNAFRTRTVTELTEAFTEAKFDPEVGVAVLTGQGDKAFCSGGDQKERGGEGYASDGSRPMDVDAMHNAIRRCPKPVIAMVNGFAIGGGHVLHVVCDLTIAAEHAVFGQTGPRVGSVDAGYGTAYLAREGVHDRAPDVRAAARHDHAPAGEVEVHPGYFRNFEKSTGRFSTNALRPSWASSDW